MWDDFECAPRSLCAYSAERLFIISRLSHSAECDKRYFHRRGRGGKRQLPRLFPRGNSHAAGALRHGSQHDPLSHRCAMPDFPLSSLRASSPRSGWKSFLKGRAKSTAESLLMMPNTLAMGFKPWLPLRGSWCCPASGATRHLPLVGEGLSGAVQFPADP